MAGQRSVVKHSYIKAFRDGRGRARAHVNYIKFRPGKDKDEAGSRAFFSDREDGLTSQHVNYAIDRQKGRGVLVHKVIISPGVQDANTQEYVREVLHDLGHRKGLDLEWYAVEHRNTANPHAHVVIMGTDKKGRQVSLSKADYTQLKECGDRYLERNKLLDREKTKEEKKARLPGRKLKEALKAAKKEFDRVMRSDVEERKLSRLEAIRAQEAESLGDAPDYKALAAKREAKEERRNQAKAEAWAYYSKAIEVELAGETVKYNWTMPIGDLRALERQHNLEAQRGKAVLSAEDLERLQTWIKDAYFEEKVLAAKSAEVEKLELTASVGPAEYVELKVSKASTLEELNAAKRLHESGKVALSPVEDKALTIWISEKEAVEPIAVVVPGLEEPVVYDKQDSKESLEFLANEYRKGEDWAKDGITKAQYKKLRAWIKEKRELEQKEKPKEKEPETKPLHEKALKDESKDKGES
ncbi:MAG: hypothetical protein KGS72_21500 [Cyanobacteria bacterium REEB67]|nr:hypothetical protein [Cyanobacteria bacterium REEB67]